MKIAKVEALHCDGGWRPWTFVRIETDDGLVGWGECSDNRSPYGIAGAVRDMADLLIGQDPRPVERLYWDMLRRTRQNLGGVTHKAIAGIELALWDIKAKALGVPVYELFGGPLRDRMRLYWSHCGTTRARIGDVLGTPPLRTYDDITALGQGGGGARVHRAQDQHRHPGRAGAPCTSPASRAASTPPTARRRVEILDAIERLIGTFRDAVGPKVGLCLDLNYNFRTEGVLRIAKLLEQFDMQWVEYDNWDPQALLQIKQSTSTRLASCESLVTTRQYRPFLELHAVDVAHHRRAVERLLAGACRSAGWPRPTRSTSRRTTTTATWPTCTRCTSARCCRTCASWRSTSTTCRGRKRWSPRRRTIKDGHILLPTRRAGARTSTRRCCGRTRGRARATRARQLFYGMDPRQMTARP